MPPRGYGGYGGNVAGEQILNPQLEPSLGSAIRSEGLARLWAQAEPLPGGRGTARLLAIEGTDCVIKRDSRGGVAGLVLPDRYLRRDPFLREWALGIRLSGMGLAVEPLAMEFVPAPPGFRAFSLSRGLFPSHSLAALWIADEMEGRVLTVVGGAVGRLHREGVLHGDLNAGNLLVCGDERVVFLDLRHSISSASPLALESRKSNLARLGRSLHKLHSFHGHPWPKGAWQALVDGYAAGWGTREPWLEVLPLELEQGHPLRRILWNMR